MLVKIEKGRLTAFATLQTCPKQTRLLRKTASAMNPANQKIMFSISAATMPTLWPAAVLANFHGTTIR